MSFFKCCAGRIRCPGTPHELFRRTLTVIIFCGVVTYTLVECYHIFVVESTLHKLDEAHHDAAEGVPISSSTEQLLERERQHRIEHRALIEYLLPFFIILKLTIISIYIWKRCCNREKRNNNNNLYYGSTLEPVKREVVCCCIQVYEERPRVVSLYDF